eukprot:NODE_1638_length_813_cov_185.574607_g1275_i0.p1 GENE.NODE_1638_length_813_cov_185.574607_g1275_i0~~NODE_1638_length_813_cov_185.574607_g1275_i0.p1  ORF type:complete len:98 (-),score=24.17 NODE_1638_length_813_cov_185.574607_g1275_i0:167-460(-)
MSNVTTAEVDPQIAAFLPQLRQHQGMLKSRLMAEAEKEESLPSDDSPEAQAARQEHDEVCGGLVAEIDRCLTLLRQLPNAAAGLPPSFTAANLAAKL